MFGVAMKSPLAVRYVVSALLLLTACGGFATATYDGVYRAIRYSEESGDAYGFEVTVKDLGAASTVDLVVCEGGCSEKRRWPAVVSGKSISFAVTDNEVDQDGRPVKTPPVHYSGVFDDGALTLRSSDDRDLKARLPYVAKSTF